MLIFHSELQGQWLPHTVVPLSSSSGGSVSPGPCDLCTCVHATSVLGIRSYLHLLSKALESWFAKTYLKLSFQTSTGARALGLWPPDLTG